MNLLHGKKQGFILSGEPLELLRASTLPGAVWRKKESVIRLPENVSSWKVINNLDLDEISDIAQERMDSIGSKYKESRRRLRAAEARFKLRGETDIDVPLKSVPYEHQVRAFGFCSSLDSSGLFMDQGTGKTLVAIAIVGKRFLEGLVNHVVVVSPKSVKGVWPGQLSSHAGYRWSASVGDNPPRNKPGGKSCMFWVVSYDELKGKSKQLRKWGVDQVIFDESHRMKNRSSGRFKSAREFVKKIKYRLLMTGTPIGKCVSEIWSQYHLINKNVFGSYSEFKKNFLQMGGFRDYQVVGIKNEEIFDLRLHGHSFRVTKDECLDLPPISYQRIYVTPNKKLRESYDQFAEQLFLEVGDSEITAPGEAVAQMKLRQITGGRVKDDEGVIQKISNIKSEALRDFLEDRLGKKTLIFFSFTEEINMAREICKKLKIKTFELTGKTPSGERNSFEMRFQSFDGPAVALIQATTGAEGLTLHAADYALFYSPSFSYVAYAQARDRIHRIGQTRPVTIGFMVVEKTVDERVVEVLECNGQLVNAKLNDNRNYHTKRK